MDKIKNDKSSALCTIACLIPVFSYGIERVYWNVNSHSAALSLILAIVFTLLAACVYLIITKISNSFYGMIASMLAFKMMPPDNPALSHYSVQGGTVYKIVQAFCLILFAALIIRNMKLSKQSDNSIETLPVVALMFALPMLEQFVDSICAHLYILTGSLYGPYFTQFIFYLLATIIVFVLTYRCNQGTIKFICTFQIIAMIINIVRRLGTIAILLVKGSHISMSYYCWILIYVAIMVAFSYLQKKSVNSK